jgi:N6-adenosine-specific RNA methylase IME4
MKQLLKSGKKYKIIYADPPWHYKQGSSMGSKFQGACDKYYNTMSIEELCKLPVNKLADKNCMLFLWVTFPQLVEGLKLIKAWGFEYKTIGFNWIKQNSNGTPFFGIGYYTKSNGEVCLLAIKGKPHKWVKDNTISQVIFTKKDKHSKKPPIVRNKIIQLLGDLPRIELFARERIEGWDSWGNQLTDYTQKLL